MQQPVMTGGSFMELCYKSLFQPFLHLKVKDKVIFIYFNKYYDRT